MAHVDIKALQELAIMDPPGMSAHDEKSAVREIILLFIEHSAIWYTELLNASVIGDTIKLSQTAHTFKSSAGYVGAHHLRELCELLEHGAAKNSSAQNEHLVEAIRLNQLQVAAELKKYIGM